MPTKQQQPPRPSGSKDAGLQHLFGVAFESLPSGLVLFDKRLRVILRNQAAKALLPNEPDIPGLLSKLAIESRYEDWTTEVRKVLESGLPRRLDVDGHGQNDRPDLDVIISQLPGGFAGEAIGGLLVAEDVSTRASMERRLAISERLAAVGKLAARVAHELNNPLDGILRYTNLALRLVEKLEDGSAEGGDGSVRQLAGYLKNAKTGAVRMTEIIASLLEFSRNAPSSFEQATINKIVEDAVAAMESRAAESNVSVICNFLQADMPVVRGSNVFQVFCNLIKNAIEAMPGGGTLTITTRLTEADVVATFEDTGVGLPEEADKVFEPFFTTKAPGKGTGLGLAVCKELIEKYSGTITAANRSPRGAVFTVKAPLSKLAASLAQRWTARRVGEQRAGG